jgi:PadR family transcriptional regulator, regulatory protein PadR
MRRTGSRGAGMKKRGTAQSDALRGTLELLVLKALTLEPMHGWGIGQRLEQLSRGVLEVNQGSLYPALQRLEHQGLIESEWGESENNRRARFYRLTRAGRRALGAETVSWRRFAEAVEHVLAVESA